jgi:hypothetical protein
MAEADNRTFRRSEMGGKRALDIKPESGPLGGEKEWLQGIEFRSLRLRGLKMKRSDEVLEATKIVLFSMGAAIVYGLVHDQVTAHVCVEYFSIAHPPVFATSSPFLLGLGWGVIATWWVGLPLGLGLLVAARLGRAPRLGLAQLRAPIIKLMMASAIAALVSGALGAVLVAQHLIEVPGGWGAVIPLEKHVAFSADAWAHLASYGFGIVGGVVLIGHTAWRRLQSAPLSKGAPLNVA